MELVKHSLSTGLLLVLSVGARPLPAQPAPGVVPTFAVSDASGCQGLFLYAWNEARSEVLTIRVDRDKVPLTEETTTLDLARATEGVAVQVELTAARRAMMPFCSEAGQATDDRPSIWVARSGILRLAVRRRASALVTPVSVTIDRLVVASPAGVETRARRTIRFVAAVSDYTP